MVNFATEITFLQMHELHAMKLFHEMFKGTPVMMAVDAIIFQKKKALIFWYYNCEMCLQMCQHIIRSGAKC